MTKIFALCDNGKTNEFVMTYVDQLDQNTVKPITSILESTFKTKKYIPKFYLRKLERMNDEI